MLEDWLDEALVQLLDLFIITIALERVSKSTLHF